MKGTAITATTKTDGKESLIRHPIPKKIWAVMEWAFQRGGEHRVVGIVLAVVLRYHLPVGVAAGTHRSSAQLGREKRFGSLWGDGTAGLAVAKQKGGGFSRFSLGSCLVFCQARCFSGAPPLLSTRSARLLMVLPVTTPKHTGRALACFHSLHCMKKFTYIYQLSHTYLYLNCCKAIL